MPAPAKPKHASGNHRQPTPKWACRGPFWCGSTLQYGSPNARPLHCQPLAPGSCSSVFTGSSLASLLTQFMFAGSRWRFPPCKTRMHKHGERGPSKEEAVGLGYPWGWERRTGIYPISSLPLALPTHQILCFSPVSKAALKSQALLRVVWLKV